MAAGEDSSDGAMPRLIGLTGGVATGKSTVARLLAARGAVIVDADQLAREAVEPGSPALAEIAAEFGPAALRPDGALDRPAVAALVFADAGRRRRLEAITHPRIQALMADRIVAALGTQSPLVVADIPLLYENGRDAMFEGVMVVWCDRATQLARLVTRDGLDPAEAERRLAAQMPADEKRARATWVIDNNGSEADTAAQVARWWEREVG
jgi:dephospho-CoA kinase